MDTKTLTENISRYHEEYEAVPNEPLGIGADTEDWGWRDHLANLRLRTDSLAAGVTLGMPPPLIRGQIELIRSRVESIAAIMDKLKAAEHPATS